MNRRGFSIVTLLAGCLLGATLTAVGLAQAGKLVPERPQILVGLGQKLEVAHRSVDVMVGNGDIADAVAALDGLRPGPWPSVAEGGEAAVQLRHDAYGRLLRLRLDHPEVDPQPREAMLELVTEALGDDPEIEANPFTARLWALRGEVLEAQGDDDAALGAYERALDINQILLERELAGGGQ